MFFKKKCMACGSNNPKDAVVCASCGAPFELKQAEGQTAIKDYDETMRQHSQDANAYYERGATYDNMEKYKEAIEHYDEAVRLKPEFAVAYYMRGRAYAIMKKNKQALKDLDKAIRLNPELAAAYRMRGMVYFNLDNRNKDKFIADFEKYATLVDDPEQIEWARHTIKEISK